MALKVDPVDRDDDEDEDEGTADEGEDIDENGQRLLRGDGGTERNTGLKHRQMEIFVGHLVTPEIWATYRTSMVKITTFVRISFAVPHSKMALTARSGCR